MNMKFKRTGDIQNLGDIINAFTITFTPELN